LTYLSILLRHHTSLITHHAHTSRDDNSLAMTDSITNFQRSFRYGRRSALKRAKDYKHPVPNCPYRTRRRLAKNQATAGFVKAFQLPVPERYSANVIECQEEACDIDAFCVLCRKPSDG
jgi:hypothetical protein